MKYNTQDKDFFSGVRIVSLVVGIFIVTAVFGLGTQGSAPRIFAADINLNVDNDGVVRDSSGKILKGTKIDIPQKSISEESAPITDKKITTPVGVTSTTVQEDVKAVIASEKVTTGTQKKLDARYRVEKVERIRANAPGKKDIVRFSGKATPNTSVTIYIYSTPTVVVVQSDAEGNWSYDLTQDLEDGDHEVFVAVTDATGKISAYGEGVGFVKTAEAITVKPVASAAVMEENQSPLERSRFEYVIVAFISILVFFGIALIVVSRRAAR
jgi:hypothetical protein